MNEFRKINKGNILEIFKSNVKFNPNQIALQEAEQYITYQELDERSNKIAQFLLDQHLDPNFHVGTFMPRSIDLFTAWLGILKAGGTYIPLDPDNPDTRTQYIIDDARIKIVLTSNHTLTNKREFEHTETININAIYRNNNNFEVNELSTDQVACIIYTSGSTGTPKGVKVKVKGIKRLVVEPNYVQFKPGDSVGQISNLAFDAVTFEMWGALLNGCRLVIIDYETILSPHALKETINRNDINTMFMTVSLFNKLISYDGTMFENMSTLIVGGEALSSKWIKKCLEEGPPNHLINGYGPTETTTFALTHEIKALPSHHNIPIGKPISNTTAFILNENLKKQPIGVTGELYIGGEGVAEGYLNNDVLTKENFVLNPFNQHEIIYKTGDLARYLPNGDIEYIGRKDKQVKLRGFRIELGEIEKHLQNHTDITDVKVIVHKDDNDQKYLTAYYISHQVIDDDVLNDYVKESLPVYMHPSAYAKLESFPLTSNGKLDEKALSKVNPTKISKKVEACVEPRTEMEELLYSIFKEVLGVEKISITDNFFEIGGHSLLAMQVISNIKDKIRREVSIKQLFDCPSIEDLAIELERQKQNIDIIPNISSQFKTHPLSSSQKQVWFLDKLKNGDISYNIPIAFRLKDNVDLNLLEQSINMLINRHKALRTVILEEDGIPFQKIMPENFRELEVINIENSLEKLINEEAWKPFDLKKGPMFKFKVFKHTIEGNVLFLNFHHIIFDGESEKIFFKELKHIYNALQSNNSIELPNIETQYTDFIYAEKEKLNSPLGEKQLNFWKEKLAGELPVLNLSPTTPRNIETGNFNGKSKHFEVPNELTKKLEGICKKENVTLNMLLLSAFQVLINRYTRENDIIIGTPIAKRTSKQLENMIGFLVNTTVIRSYVNEEVSFKEFLAQVKETTLNAYSNSDIPFERIVEEINPVRENGIHPIFQIMYLYHNDFNKYSNQIFTKNINIENRSSKFDLSLSLTKKSEVITGEVQFNTQVYDPLFVNNLVKNYLTILDNINLNSKIKDLMYFKNESNLDYSSTNITNIPIHKLFEQTVQKYKHKVAIKFGEEEITYGDLNLRVNQIANLLKKKNVGVGDVIGIRLPKSIDFIAAVLAVLKIGACNLTLDISLPEKRINKMMKISNAKFLITYEYFNENIPNIETVYLNSNTLENSDIDSNFNSVNDLNLDSYIIFTSGSTGEPKGIKNTHVGVINYFDFLFNTMNLSLNDVVLQLSTFSVDGFIRDFLAPIIIGAKVILLNEDHYKDHNIIENILIKEDVNILLSTTPSFLNALSNNLEKEINNINLIFSSGEHLNENIIEKTKRKFPESKIINLYGPSECTLTTTFNNATNTEKNDLYNVGLPINNMNIYILDDEMRILPNGTSGNIYIGGLGLSTQYINSIELNKLNYFKNPINLQETIYKTGDIGFKKFNGELILQGRKDRQIKIRGFRVELDEIEKVAESLFDIESAIAINIPKQKQNRIFLFTKNYNDGIEEQISKDIKQALPDYMMPNHIIEIKKLPMTNNGKKDRKALIKEYENYKEERIQINEKLNVTEKKVKEVFERVLEIENINLNNDFFELGGHSLLATQIASRLKKSIGITIPIKLIFDHPNVKALSEKIEKLNKQQKSNSLTSIKKIDRESFKF